MRNALSDIAKKEGIDDSPQSIFAFLIDRVRANLHIVLCMSPVGDLSGELSVHPVARIKNDNGGTIGF